MLQINSSISFSACGVTVDVENNSIYPKNIFASAPATLDGIIVCHAHTIGRYI